MKRFIIVLCALLIAGCSSQATASSAPNSSAIASVAAPSEIESQAASSAPEKMAESSAQGSDFAVDKGLLDVTITIPADFGVASSSDFDSEAYAKENGFKKAVVDDDGSVTITMSKNKYNEMLLESRNGVEKAFKEMIESGNTPYIKSIKSDKDYKNITINVDKVSYEEAFDLSPMSVSMTAMFYQMLNGNETKCTVLTKDEKTGEVLNTFIFPDDMQ